MTQKPLQAFRKKAFEIAYAVSRIADVSPNAQFAAYMRQHSFSLLESSQKLQFSALRIVIDALEYGVQIGDGSGSLGKRNTDVLMGELSKFREAIGVFEDYKAEVGEIDIAGFFGESLNTAIAEIQSLSIPEYPARAKKPSISIADKPLQDKLQDYPAKEKEEVLSSGERENQLLEIIGVGDEVRFRDIAEKMPQVSERTLRYDLQGLVEQGKVTRLGTGPSISYRLSTISGFPGDISFMETPRPKEIRMTLPPISPSSL
jgi:hypothetical protein